MEKLIKAAIENAMHFYWSRSLSGLELRIVTAQFESGRQRSKHVTFTSSIDEAMRLTTDILSRGGLVDIETLTSDVYWQFGWQPEMVETRHAMQVAFERSPRYRQCDWIGFSAAMRKGAQCSRI